MHRAVFAAVQFFRFWPLTSFTALRKCGRYRINSGQAAPSVFTGSAAFDPERTIAIVGSDAANKPRPADRADSNAERVARRQWPPSSTPIGQRQAVVTLGQREIRIEPQRRLELGQ
jgi:hypothetical protein